MIQRIMFISLCVQKSVLYDLYCYIKSVIQNLFLKYVALRLICYGLNIHISEISS